MASPISGMQTKNVIVVLDKMYTRQSNYSRSISCPCTNGRFLLRDNSKNLQNPFQTYLGNDTKILLLFSPTFITPKCRQDKTAHHKLSINRLLQ